MQGVSGRVSALEEVLGLLLSNEIELKSLLAPIGYKRGYSGSDWESLLSEGGFLLKSSLSP